MNTMSTKLSALLAALVLSVALAAPAFGQSVSDGYSEEGAVIETQAGGGGAGGGGGSGTDPVSASDDSGNLPFTGLDLGLIGGSGLLLLGAGLGMRHLTRAPQPGTQRAA